MAIWDYAGIMLFDLTTNSGDMNNILNWASENNFEWVALQCFNDTTLIEQTQIPIWKSAIQSRRLTFGLWGVHHDDPSGDATRADSQIDLWGAEFYIANAETEYKVDGPGTRAHSATFVTAYRALQPSLPSALSTYGAIANDVGILGSVTSAAAGVMDLKAWYDAAFDYLPQAYASDPVTVPYRCTQHARRCGWPFNRFHLTAGIYVGGDTFDGADYRVFFADHVNTEWEMDIQADNPRVFYKLQDVSGNPVDSSANGLNIGTVVGTPDYQSAGLLDHVATIRLTGGETLARAVPSTAVNNIAMEMLFQYQAVGANDQKIFYMGNSGADGWGMLTSVDGSYRGLLGGVAFMDTAGTLVANNWYHMVLTREAGTWKYYLNGVVTDTSASVTAPGAPTGNLQIGDASIQIACCMFAIHEQAMTAAMVTDRYAKLVAGRTTGSKYTLSPHGFSLFLGETSGSLGTVVEQDYIDLGLAVTEDAAADIPPPADFTRETQATYSRGTSW